MRKTKNVSKYDLDWQIVRVSVKGPKTNVYAKLSKVLDFFDNNKSKENWERVTNWLEGLLLGYKKPQTLHSLNAFNSVNEILKTFKAIDIDTLPSIESINDFSKHSFEERYTLWVDLFKRTKAWGQKGYIHREQLEFCEQLWKSFSVEEYSVISALYNKEAFDDMISRAIVTPNTHKFLF
jgi:hypothetical protein